MKHILLLVLLTTTTLLGQSLEDKLRRISLAIEMGFSAATLEKQRDDKLRQLQNPVKNEFETQAMFNKRKADAANKAKELRNEYEGKIADAKRSFDQRISELKQELDQLLATSEQDVVSVFTLGMYDADRQQFPITLAATQQSFDISISLQMAREFKNASSSLHAQGKKRLTRDAGYEFYDWRLTYNGQAIPFGPQKGKQRVVASQSQPIAPAQLKTSVAFTEPSGNLMLDANESGEIAVTITNSGQGAAFGVEVTAKLVSGGGIALSPSAYIGEIPSGQTRTAKLALRADGDVANGKATAVILYGESNGFAPTGNKITFETKALVPPKPVPAAKKSLGIDWVLVQGGPGGDFYISATEVTFDQFDKFCDATGHEKPRADFGRGKHPVINVNVADAVAYCKWLSMETGTTVRLPEEDEWEYAAKGGNKSKGYDYSGSNAIDEVAWYYGNSAGRTHEVATKKPSELGSFDMSGNVEEWCGTSGAIRGGSWNFFDGSCRVSSRSGFSPVYRLNFLGFRVLQKK